MKRLCNAEFAFPIALILLLPIIIATVLVKFTSKDRVFYSLDRISQNIDLFKRPKFRSLNLGSPVVATHLLETPNNPLAPIGDFLRKSSPDELLQLCSTFMGNMSFVGPVQRSLIKKRTLQVDYKMLTGVTGWTQVNGCDELPVFQAVKLEIENLKYQSMLFNIKILCLA